EPLPACVGCGEELPRRRMQCCGKPECRKEQKRRYYEANRDRYREWMAQYHAAHRDGRRAYHRARYQANLETERQRRREWHASPSGRASDLKKSAKRRDALSGAPNDGTGPIDWLAAMEERDDWCCALCDGAFRPGDELHWDHATPVSRGGGTTLDNMHAAHAACNISRSNKPIDEWRAAEGIT